MNGSAPNISQAQPAPQAHEAPFQDLLQFHVRAARREQPTRSDHAEALWLRHVDRLFWAVALAFTASVILLVMTSP